MSMKEVEVIEEGLVDRQAGIDARWKRLPLDESASDVWKSGWKEAEYELSGDETVDFYSIEPANRVSNIVSGTQDETLAPAVSSLNVGGRYGRHGGKLSIAEHYRLAT